MPLGIRVVVCFSNPFWWPTQYFVGESNSSVPFSIQEISSIVLLSVSFDSAPMVLEKSGLFVPRNAIMLQIASREVILVQNDRSITCLFTCLL